MKLSHVHAVIAVADAGSIRAAAVVLGKTQSTLTKQLQQFEEEVGLPLFLRTSRGVVPTEDGRAVLSRVRAIQSEIRHLDEEIDLLKGQGAGTVRVSASPLAAVRLLPRAIARFTASNPEVEITISSDMFGDALAALRTGVHDIIIGPHGAAMNAGDVTVEELVSTEIIVITSTGAPLAQATSLRDLINGYWIMMGDTAGPPKTRFQEQFTRHGLEPPKIRMASESCLGLLSLVRELDAVCTYPARLLDEMEPEAGVTRIPIRETLKPLMISMVTRAGKSLTPTAEAFADCIRHRAGVLRREWADQSPSARMAGASGANL